MPLAHAFNAKGTVDLGDRQSKYQHGSFCRWRRLSVCVIESKRVQEDRRLNI
jgi:hypothetical protein